MVFGYEQGGRERSPAGGLLGHRSGGDASFHLGCAEGVGLWDIQVKLSWSRWSHRSGGLRVAKARG